MADADLGVPAQRGLRQGHVERAEDAEGLVQGMRGHDDVVVRQHDGVVARVDGLPLLAAEDLVQELELGSLAVVGADAGGAWGGRLGGVVDGQDVKGPGVGIVQPAGRGWWGQLGLGAGKVAGCPRASKPPDSNTHLMKCTELAPMGARIRFRPEELAKVRLPVVKVTGTMRLGASLPAIAQASAARARSLMTIRPPGPSRPIPIPLKLDMPCSAAL